MLQGRAGRIKKPYPFRNKFPALHYTFDKQFNMKFSKRINAGTNIGSQWWCHIFTMCDIKEKPLQFGALSPISLISQPLRCLDVRKLLHLSLSVVGESSLKVDGLPRMQWMDCVASGVGKVIRRKMSTKRRIQTFQLRSYDESLWFGHSNPNPERKNCLCSASCCFPKVCTLHLVAEFYR